MGAFKISIRPDLIIKSIEQNEDVREIRPQPDEGHNPEVNPAVWINIGQHAKKIDETDEDPYIAVSVIL
ncbi:hypothetical protein VP1G_06201 [Cytospora mali]|uniref:Uncharacterized protein n=1 Tax=Cytospora mali TaxID=578113 RepID=A0A194V514_CYTMA|nr:hypothetical protein VP1G_06201 [Valsa mali var. pyri (nom. inval.)]